jgi:O-succinylbenzoic acid--CoA ligase
MISIKTPQVSLTKSEVAHRVDSLAQTFSSVKREECIALYLDSSLDGVLLLLTAIKLGLKVALCPLREPPKILDEWLFSLGVNKLFSSCQRTETATLSSEILISNDLRNDFSSIMRTSGSTGFSKSALINFSAHMASAQAVNRYFGFQQLSNWLLSLPLYHVGGLAIVMRALAAGGGIYIAQNHEQMVAALRTSHLSYCSLVPAQLKRLITEKVNLSHLDGVVIGGDALGARDREQALKQGWPIYESYGLTESASMVWVNNSQSGSGSALSHAKILLADDGEIGVKADSLFCGYLEAGQLNLPLNAEGFFFTGDIGKLDEFNQLQLIGRKNNRIISGGENIQAEEIERVLESHPHIDVCVVVGVEDNKYGMRPVAFVKWSRQALSLNEITVWLKSRLAAYKWPDKLISWPPQIATDGKKPRAVLARLMGEMF